jgi:hypothetical protein
MVVINREIIRQHLAIEAVEWMNVSAAIAIGRHSGFGHDTMVINENRAIAFPQTERTIVHSFKPE